MIKKNAWVWALALLAPLAFAAGDSAAPDVDGDGLPDTIDQCPGTTAGVLVDPVGCAARLPPWPPEDGAVAAAAGTEAGLPLADADHDGIYDLQDSCPGTAPNTPIDPNGCALMTPAPVAAAPVVAAAVEPPLPVTPIAPVTTAEPVSELVSEPVIAPSVAPAAVPPPTVLAAPAPRLLRSLRFDSQSARLRDDTRRALDEVLKALKAQPALRLDIVGHGDSAANAWLAQARAQAVHNFLAGLGAAPAQLQLRAAGRKETQASVDPASVELRVLAE